MPREQSKSRRCRGWFGQDSLLVPALLLLTSSSSPPWTIVVQPPVVAALAPLPTLGRSSGGWVVPRSSRGCGGSGTTPPITSRWPLFATDHKEELTTGTGAAAEKSTTTTTTFSSSTMMRTTRIKNEQITTAERPDPSILLSSRDSSTQRWAFGAIVASLVVGTVVMVLILELLQDQLLPSGWFEWWRDYTWPIPLGGLYVAAGIAHFIRKDTFVAMVPPRGTWGGLWQIPAPGAHQLGWSYGEYHTYWSGLAEIGGGTLLLVAAVTKLLPVSIPAWGLFLLTASVTPANIYMATHDVQPPGLPPVPYPTGHLARGVMQCVLLAFFWELTFP